MAVERPGEHFWLCHSLTLPACGEDENREGSPYGLFPSLPEPCSLLASSWMEPESCLRLLACRGRSLSVGCSPFGSSRSILGPPKHDIVSVPLVLRLPVGLIPWQALAGDIRQEENVPTEIAGP